MTVILLLGAIAAAYLLWLLFRIAALALPMGIGVGCAAAMLDHGAGPVVAIGCGLALGGSVHLAGQGLYAAARSPLVRTFILLLFAGPAGVAGYQASRSVAHMMAGEGMLSLCLMLAAAAAAAAAAARHVRRSGQAGGRGGAAASSAEPGA